ncbi:MAG: imidazolonepropionase [Planctomycetota bacterium]
MTGLLVKNATLAPGEPPMDVLCRGDMIVEVGRSLAARGAEILDLERRALVPGFVDCHTHACWAGCRLDEWEQIRAGASYLDVLRAGGGIMSTVRAVRDVSEADLVDGLVQRLGLCLAHGTTTIEIKSGYGLSTADEMKMLRAITSAGEHWPGTAVPTACIGHAKPLDDGGFVERTIRETLPAVTAEFPGIAIDAYCEAGAWTLAECLRLFDAAIEAGHPVRVHADQFHDLGMVPEAISRGFRSVDHLEATEPGHLEALAVSGTAGVMLPASGWHLDGRYADGRAFVDAGGTLALATNLNPGSAPCFSVPMIMGLAVRHLGLTCSEALEAVTAGGAHVLGLADRGRIAPGQRADCVVLQTRDVRDACFYLGGSLVAEVIVGGRRLVSPRGTDTASERA